MCVGTITASGASTSCIHITTGETAQSQVWYAFGCDHSTQNACSASASGSGASGSPYYINHAPTFTTAPVTPTLNPGGTAVFTVASGSWGDVDTTPTQDTGKLLVCDTSGTRIDIDLTLSNQIIERMDILNATLGNIKIENPLVLKLNLQTFFLDCFLLYYEVPLSKTMGKGIKSLQ